MQHFVYGEPQVPCLFIFGDSLSDNGNNNLLITSAKANYKPYGIDYPDGSTGRSTNNRNSIDIIGQLLGFNKSIPPFVNIVGSDIMKGVNYASSSAGILDESGSNLGARLSLNTQIRNHRITVDRIGIRVGDIEKAKEYINKCLYYMNIGSNDYINNYFLDWSPTRRIYSLEEYTEILIDRYSRSLQDLYEYGARKFVIVGTGFLGCTLQAISTRGTNGSCVEEMNNASFIFNDKLKDLVDQVNSNSSDMKSIFVNMASTTLYEGPRVSNASCCPTMGDGRCVRNQKPCQNRTDYVFWDATHPTDVVNEKIAIISYNASDPNITHPMDINHFVQSG
ncbi:hypothetical protein VNO77_44373 [Canavalia gladiata]|uniref:Uncharacterized protein n=1 Tax=Canavalia gladiata TaxID=3824 RepID=A0AAN9JY46_CANGL